MDELEMETNQKWKLCCSKSDSQAIKYISQLIVCLLVMLFCFIKLTVTEDDKEIYISLLSFVLGVILPSPSYKK